MTTCNWEVFCMKTQTIIQIALLDDMLSKTSALCLLLQSDKMDFRAVSRAIEFTVSRLECMISYEKGSSSKLYKVFWQWSMPIIEMTLSLELLETLHILVLSKQLSCTL